MWPATADGCVRLKLWAAGFLNGNGISSDSFLRALFCLLVGANGVLQRERSFALGLAVAAVCWAALLVIPAAQGFISAYGGGEHSGWLWWRFDVPWWWCCCLVHSAANDVSGATRSKSRLVSQTMEKRLCRTSAYSHYWLLVVGVFLCVCFSWPLFTVSHGRLFVLDQGFSSEVAVASLSLDWTV